MYMYISLARLARPLYVFRSPDCFEIYSQRGKGLTTYSISCTVQDLHARAKWPRQTLQAQVHHHCLPAIIVALQTCYYSIACILHS